ncbi:class I adenylate-forming enzyme family protein [Nocardia harenae]|uniref:class I adenylate-forming enzyme family protein n=1 Tax=Nocardia harenae TaxID=358707 RepID=UPI00082AA4D4|nr:AMP-binding protein [Nocardia harenae]
MGTATGAGLPVGNIADWPAFHARYSGDRVALRFEGRTVTWAALDDRIRRVAAGLRSLGVERGARVGLLLRNHPAFYETVFAAARIGAVAAPLNIRLTGPEVADCVTRGRITTLVTEPHFDGVLGALGDVIAEDRVLVVDHAPGRTGRAYETLAGYSADAGAPELVYATDPALMLFTSGTSGRPKGVLLSHRNVYATAAGARAFDGTRPEDRLVLPVPLAYTGPLVSASLPVLAAGGTVGLERELDLDSLAKDLTSGWATMFQVVPVVYEQLAARPDFGSLVLDEVRVAKTGGAAIREETLRAFVERGLPVVNSYGLTEASGLSIQVPRHAAMTRLGAAGVPMPGLEAKVVDDAGETLADGVEGELVLRGPSVMLGYDDEPEATARTVCDGWLHTGDVVRMDEGYVTVLERRSDLIISGGLNVYPAEIERVLVTHPEIREVAVVARRDERWGQVPVACVVPVRGELTLDDLTTFLRPLLADYKRPRHLLRLDELPRGMSGKVLTGELRRRAEAMDGGCRDRA